MNNDVIGEAIAGLASAIRLLNWNSRSSEAAARVEGIIQWARRQDELLGASARTMVGVAPGSNLAHGEPLLHDPATESLHDMLRVVICQGVLGQREEITKIAKIAAEAFKAGIAEFNAPAAAAAAPASDRPAPAPGNNALLLIELQAIRAELAALRKHAGAPVVKVADSERLAHMPPPPGAQCGRWEFAAGQAAPFWIETPAPMYDPTTGSLAHPRPANPAAAGLRI